MVPHQILPPDDVPSPADQRRSADRISSGVAVLSIRLLTGWPFQPRPQITKARPTVHCLNSNYVQHTPSPFCPPTILLLRPALAPNPNAHHGVASPPPFQLRAMQMILLTVKTHGRSTQQVLEIRWPQGPGRRKELQGKDNSALSSSPSLPTMPSVHMHIPNQLIAVKMKQNTRPQAENTIPSHHLTMPLSPGSQPRFPSCVLGHLNTTKHGSAP